MTTYFLGIIAGVFTALIGIGYRIGSKGKVFPIQTAMLLYVAGFVFFSWRSAWNCNMPGMVWFFGILAGITQYATVRILREVLQRGPLSPAWCAVGLSFVPALVYCWFFEGENPTKLQLVSVAATFGAIVVASIGNAKTASASAHKIESGREMVIYGILLTAILLFCGIIYIVLKMANYIAVGDSTMFKLYGNQIMALTYVFMFFPSTIDLSISKTWRLNRYFLYGAIFLAVGGIGSYGIQLFIMDAPAVVVFALPGVTSVLLASLISVLCFHEKRTVYWYVTIGLAIIAIITNR